MKALETPSSSTLDFFFPKFKTAGALPGRACSGVAWLGMPKALGVRKFLPGKGKLTWATGAGPGTDGGPKAFCLTGRFPKSAGIGLVLLVAVKALDIPGETPRSGKPHKGWNPAPVGLERKEASANLEILEDWRVAHPT